jgi:hypothetical protein
MIQPASKDWIQQAFVREFGNKLSSGDFYYNENGQMVMTETYHRKRGSCCGNGCKHCAYFPAHKKGNTILKDIY